MVRMILRHASVTFQSQSSPFAVSSLKQLAGGNIARDGSKVNVYALNDISLCLKPGDKLGIVGRNGAGKTTLLRMMAGIYPPKTGFVSVEGTIATLFNLGLGMNMEASGYKNIVLSGIVAGLSKEEIANRIDDIAEFTGLGDFLNLPIKSYSAGMAMRLKFACATAFEADILLLDEWLGAGDASFQSKAKERMDHLVSQSGLMVLATHNQRLMKETCNKAIWLKEGQIVKSGPVEEVIEASRENN